MTYIKKILAILIVLVFMSYWGITLIFSFPESSIVIAENHKAYKRFQIPFYQKWNFFAPPPTYNLRLHYIFKSENNLYDIEVFENLNKKVREKYLFNNTYANTNWFLFSNTDNIVQVFSTIHNTFQDLNNSKNINTYSSDSIALTDKYNDIRKIIQNIGSMDILLNHSKIIAEELKLSENYDVQIIISAIDIVKYADRYKTNKENKERIIFATSFYNNQSKEWIEQ